MKKLFYTLMLTCSVRPILAQKTIRDDAIRYQQERMVFKQWDRDKFVPKPGFLSLNPLYWVTWALHPNYPDVDRRPLGPWGPQTQRLGLVLALQNTTDAYKLHADTLSSAALTEVFNYTGAVSSADPLWLLYYRRELAPLLEQGDDQLLYGIPISESAYLSSSGLLLWYQQQRQVLRERLLGIQNTTIDRGSRILGYHRMLAEYRKLAATWETARQRARLFLSLKSSAGKVRVRETPVSGPAPKSDREIADEILSKSKL